MINNVPLGEEAKKQATFQDPLVLVPHLKISICLF